MLDNRGMQKCSRRHRQMLKVRHEAGREHPEGEPIRVGKVSDLVGSKRRRAGPRGNRKWDAAGRGQPEAPLDSAEARRLWALRRIEKDALGGESAVKNLLPMEESEPVRERPECGPKLDALRHPSTTEPVQRCRVSQLLHE